MRWTLSGRVTQNFTSDKSAIRHSIGRSIPKNVNIGLRHTACSVGTEAQVDLLIMVFMQNISRVRLVVGLQRRSI